MNYQISVVMPALNEAANLERAVLETAKAFDDLDITGEIVIINDGSSDKTGELAEMLRQRLSFLQVIHHERPQGIGGSFWEGAHRARGEIVTMLPGDGENEPYEILRYLPLTRHVDIVVPFIYNVEIRGRERRLISKAYKAIINLSFGLLLNYMNGTVMYRRSVLQSLSLHSRGFFYQTELLIRAIRAGYLYAEVPYAIGSRGSGKSKALTLSSFFKLSKDYFFTVCSVYFINRKHKFEFTKDSISQARYIGQ